MARPEVAGDMRFIEEGAALSELADIRKQLHGIQQRNKQKEVDKAFEVSYTRVVAIMCLTYATLFGYMSIVGVQRPALNAVVPSIGFNLSTWSLPAVKMVWSRCTGRDSSSEAEAAGDEV